MLMASSLTPRVDINVSSPQRNSELKKRQMSNQQAHSPTLPEFKKVNEVAEIYSAFTQSNLRYKILHKKEKDRLLGQ